MTTSAFAIGLLVGILLGAGVVSFLNRRLRVELASCRSDLATARATAATDEQMLALFKSASGEAIAQQSKYLIDLAEAKYGTLQAGTDVVLTKHSQDVSHGLAQLGERLSSLERERTNSVVELRAMISNLSEVTATTGKEAARLASALSDNRTRGLWGEVQLRRALELAGLDRHADFVEQRGSSNGSIAGRPDAVVALPNGRCIVIDSKVPLDRYLEAVNESDAVAAHKLQVEHAKAVAGHVKALAGREYAGLVPGSVDMVLMFLPGEPFLSAALDADPTLFEAAASRGIYLVTPSSLVPLLRGVALGWREHQAEEAAAEIHRLGVELHERIGVFAGHFAKVGDQLERTVKAFNTSVGSLDSRVVSSARKLADQGAVSSKETPGPKYLEETPRGVRTVIVNEPVVDQPALAEPALPEPALPEPTLPEPTQNLSLEAPPR